MSAPLGLVLGTSLVVASPVLWMVHEGSLSATVALQRWGICLVVCWVAISVIGGLAFPDTRKGAAAAVPPESAQPETEPTVAV